MGSRGTASAGAGVGAGGWGTPSPGRSCRRVCPGAREALLLPWLLGGEPGLPSPPVPVPLLLAPPASSRARGLRGSPAPGPAPHPQPPEEVPSRWLGCACPCGVGSKFSVLSKGHNTALFTVSHRPHREDPHLFWDPCTQRGGAGLHGSLRYAADAYLCRDNPTSGVEGKFRKTRVYLSA